MTDLMTNQILPEASTRAAFPIVGLGASAGGLEALSELIAKLPADCDMAFLVVQHLDPQRPSLLTNILAKHSALAVEEAVDGVEVLPGHIYVIPPNTSMSIANSHLLLTSRNVLVGAPLPIDDLLISLAKDQGANGIGVILSGSGSDGAVGMQALHEAGGVTFAQSELSAKFPSMPLAAISSGCVDLILAPAAIAEELLRVGRHPFRARVIPANEKNTREIGEDDMGRIFRALRGECKIDFSNYKRGTINRRVARRVALRDAESILAYVALLEA